MPTPSNLQQQNNLLTNIATGYKNSAFIGTMLFPKVSVPKITGKYLRFNNEALVDIEEDSNVSINGIPNAQDFDLTSATYTLKPHGFKTTIGTEERDEQIPSNLLNLRNAKTQLITKKLELRMEREIASLVQDDSNYDATNVNVLNNTAHKYCWDNASANPIENLNDAVDAIRTDIGVFPNVIIFGYVSAKLASLVTSVQLLVNPNTASAVNITPMAAAQKLASYLGIPNVGIGMAQYATAVGGALTDVWSDNVILAYSDNLPDQNTQKFGAMLVRQNYPKVFSSFVNETDGLESIRIRSYFKAHSINWNAGYLIKNTQT